jgi:hypothetical protein
MGLRKRRPRLGFEQFAILTNVRRIDPVSFVATQLGTREVPNPGGIDDADDMTSLVQRAGDAETIAPAFAEGSAAAQLLHHNMSEDCVRVLGKLHVIDVGPDQVLHELFELPAAIAAKTQGHALMLVGIVHRADDVLGIAAAGNGDHEVTGVQDVLQLLDEHVLE